MAEPNDFEDYAARAAIAQLADYWETALADGKSLGELLPSVDTVIAKLQAFKSRLTP